MTLRIGLISDTHIPLHAKTLPPHIKEAFKNVELILHAGDIYIPSVLDELEKMAPVMAAKGNGDYDFPEDHRFQNRPIIDIGNVKIGLTHGINYPPHPEYPIDQWVLREFGSLMDVVIFGDTHVAVVDTCDGILLVNPGSPTLPNGLFNLGTVGFLEITNKKVKAHIVELNRYDVPFQRDLIYYPGAGV